MNIKRIIKGVLASILLSFVLSASQQVDAQDLWNSKNDFIGRINPDGSVYDKSNNSLGRIHSDGSVYDRFNNSLGSARGVKQEWAALYFFFLIFNYNSSRDE